MTKHAKAKHTKLTTKTQSLYIYIYIGACLFKGMLSKKLNLVIILYAKRIKLFMNFECARNIETNRITVAFFANSFL